jgi:probable HAF family extracellular repeat protein
MNAVRLRLVLYLSGVVLCTFIAASAQAQYTITDLGAFNVTALNNNGQIVGWDETGDGTEAVFYSGGVLTNFGGPGSEALAINNSGEVVGEAEFSEPPAYYEDSSGPIVVHAALWTDPTEPAVDISGIPDDNPDWPGGYAAGINDSGEIIAYSAWEAYFDYGSSGWFFSGGVTNTWGFPGNISPAAINDSGEIAGTDPAGHAAVYFDNGSTKDLGTLPGGSQSNALAINNSGEVVGIANTSGNAALHGFLYSNGSMLDLGTLGGNACYASGINDEGEIIGYSTTAISNSMFDAFIDANGSMTDLNDLIPVNSGWELEYAYAINDEGQIVGEGVNPDGDTDAYLLTPTVPEPGTGSLLGFGLLLLGRRPRRG